MEGGALCVSRGSTFCTYVHLRTCTENLRTRVRTLIDTSQNKVVCYDENEGSYTERDIRNTINNTKVKSKMIYSIKIK